ncbi:hypothetical protein [Conexivisphaera calida]|uniref:Uncharacterized protein n=1 Tax=Conexivisphaera calida TaxID=1874277 RepID=A0A4P2VE70_9ARCH|nr:hypothetical protein [Conexivisphaera calida]BBE42411.1 hypothetical protein NAS2_1022 [Conexivisphaera calida]
MSVWWPKRSKWEDKIIPLMGFEVSPRQLAIFTVAALIGADAAAALGGAGMLAQVGAFLFLLILGAVFASFPVRAVPPELVLLHALFMRPRLGAPAPVQGPPGQGAPTPGAPREVHEEPPQSVYADSDVPLVVAGEVEAGAPTRVVLLLDGKEIDAATVGPSNRRYRLVFHPRDATIGEHELAVKVGDDVVQVMRITVRPRVGGREVDLLDAAAHGR